MGATGSPGRGLVLNGPVAMTLSTSFKGQASHDLDYATWLYDCPASGGRSRSAP
jgi:hypothetical protein